MDLKSMVPLPKPPYGASGGEDSRVRSGVGMTASILLGKDLQRPSVSRTGGTGAARRRRMSLSYC